MPKVFGGKACRMTLRGAQQIAAVHAAYVDDDEPDITALERTAIFRAGALGEAAPPILQALFDRLLLER
jgi:hypothetical protein